MAEQMNLNQGELRSLLVKNLANLDPSTEKAEYLDWLLQSQTKKQKTKKRSQMEVKDMADMNII